MGEAVEDELEVLDRLLEGEGLGLVDELAMGNA